MSDNDMMALHMAVRMEWAGLMAKPVRLADVEARAVRVAAPVPAVVEASTVPAAVPVARMAGRTAQAARRATITPAVVVQAKPAADWF